MKTCLVQGTRGKHEPGVRLNVQLNMHEFRGRIAHSWCRLARPEQQRHGDLHWLLNCACSTGSNSLVYQLGPTRCHPFAFKQLVARGQRTMRWSCLFATLASMPADAFITISAAPSVGLAYNVQGRVSVPTVVKGGEYTVELEVFVEESPEATHLFAPVDTSTHFFVLSVGNESRMLDQFGSPAPYALDHAATAYPMLFRVAHNGTVTEIFYHVEDSAQSIGLKRALVSSLQLAHVERSAVAKGPIRFSAMEEDKDGPAKAEYVVRRGLIGRTTYIKHSTYEPTRRRPPEIVQTVDAVAIYGRDGSLRRISTSLHYQSNFSGKPDGDTEEVRQNITGLEHMPREPSVYTWNLRRPGDHSAMGPRGRRRLSSAGTPLAQFSFVCSTLRDDDMEEAGELNYCTGFRKQVSALLQCVIDGPTPEPKRVNCSSKLLHGAMVCPGLQVVSKLGSVLFSDRCLGTQDPEARLSDLLVPLPTPPRTHPRQPIRLCSTFRHIVSHTTQVIHQALVYSSGSSNLSLPSSVLRSMDLQQSGHRRRRKRSRGL